MTEDAARLSAPAAVAFLDLGVVAPSRECTIVTCLQDAQSVAGEELRLLRSRVRNAGKGGKLKCLALTSALPGEGKSTVCLGLAAAFAREPGRRVLLVEADLRRPTVSQNLGLPPAPGLSDWLDGELDQVPIRRLDPGGFSVLAAGQGSFERPESLGGARMEALLCSARSAFDDVFLDVPPILPVADTTLLQDLLDGFLLVVRSRLAPREAILEALGRLHREKVIGIVLNDHREYRHSYTSYAYTRYGMAYRSHSSTDRAVRPSSRG